MRYSVDLTIAIQQRVENLYTLARGQLSIGAEQYTNYFWAFIAEVESLGFVVYRDSLKDREVFIVTQRD